MANQKHSTIDRASWDQAVAALSVAQSVSDAADAVFDPIADQVDAEVAALSPLSLPADRYTGFVGGEVELVELTFQLHRARSAVDEWDSGKVHVEDYVRANYERHIAISREIIRLADERESEIATIKAKYGYPEAAQLAEATGEALSAAQTALMEMPAPDFAALLWKLEELLEVETSGYTASWRIDYALPALMDARRLCGESR